MASEHDDDLLDIISDAIDESMDVDWTSRGGARHVLGALQIGGYIRTAAMDALIADSADMIAPVRIKYDDAAIEAVQTLLETGRVTLDDEGYLVATAALSAMSPAGEVEQAVLAERERCAKIVEARVEPSWHLAAKNAAYVIAKAIREPKP